jgi:hypothetical protein
MLVDLECLRFRRASRADGFLVGKDCGPEVYHNLRTVELSVLCFCCSRRWLASRVVEAGDGYGLIRAEGLRS